MVRKEFSKITQFVVAKPNVEKNEIKIIIFRL